ASRQSPVAGRQPLRLYARIYTAALALERVCAAANGPALGRRAVQVGMDPDCNGQRVGHGLLCVALRSSNPSPCPHSALGLSPAARRAACVLSVSHPSPWPTDAYAFSAGRLLSPVAWTLTRPS